MNSGKQTSMITTTLLLLLIQLSTTDSTESERKYLQQTFPDWDIVKNEKGDWIPQKLKGSEVVKSSTQYLVIETEFKSKPVDAKKLTENFGKFAETVLKNREEEHKASLDLYIHQRYEFEECATLPLDDPSASKGQFQFWCDSENEAHVRKWSKDGCSGEKTELKWHAEKNLMKVTCDEDKLGKFVELDQPYRVPEGKTFGRKDDVLFWECVCERENGSFNPTSCRLMRAPRKDFERNIKSAIALDGGDCRCKHNVEEDKQEFRRLLEKAKGQNQKFGDAISDAFKKNLDGELETSPDGIKFGSCSAKDMGTKGKQTSAKAKADAAAIVVNNALEEALCTVLDGYQQSCEFVDKIVCGTIIFLTCPHTWWASNYWWRTLTRWMCWPVENTVCHPELRKHCTTVPKLIKDCSKTADIKEKDLTREAEALAKNTLAPVIDEISEECNSSGNKGAMQKALNERRFLKAACTMQMSPCLADVSYVDLAGYHNENAKTLVECEALCWANSACNSFVVDQMGYNKCYLKSNTLTGIEPCKDPSTWKFINYYKPDCRFHFAAAGAHVCDYGVPVSQDECEGAANSLHSQTPGRQMRVGSGGSCLDGSWGQVPLGCSVQSGGDYAAHYKTGGATAKGCVASAYQLVCTMKTKKKYELKSVGPFGLGNGILPEDSPVGYKDCSADVMKYRGPMPTGLTVCVGAALAFKQIQICVGFIFTNDGFFVPHWSYGLTKTPDVIAVRAYLNVHVWASSAAGLMGNTNEIGYTTAVAEYYKVLKIELGGQITVAVKEGEDFFDVPRENNQVADWIPNVSTLTGLKNLGPSSRIIGFNFIVGVSASLTYCDIPFVKNFFEANVYAPWILGCGTTSSTDNFYGAELKPRFKPFKSGVKCLSEL